jgi:hypothetical protein
MNHKDLAFLISAMQKYLDSTVDTEEESTKQTEANS